MPPGIEAERDGAAAELGYAVERMTTYVHTHDDPELERRYSALMVAWARWIEATEAAIGDSTEKLTRRR